MQDFEVTLIGTGGGYGESVVLRWDDGQSAVIDSCINPSSGSSLPLEYLKSQEADLMKVRFVMATHWHDDHIRGISQVLNACPEAQFWTSAARDQRMFYKLMAADKLNSGDSSMRSLTGPSQRAMKEIDDCITIISARNRRGFNRAEADKLILSDYKLDLEIFAVSPSHLVVENYEQEIAQLMDSIGSGRHRIMSLGPNDKSVAVYVKFNNERLLLGADLENGIAAAGGRTGWEAVHGDVQCINREQKIAILKVAHHGSKGAQHLGVWNEIIGSGVNSILSPWTVGEKNWLPVQEELLFIKNKSISTHITSMVGNIGKSKHRGGEVDKLVRKVGVNLSEVKFAYGLIRASWNKHMKRWSITVEGAARAA